MIIPSWGNLNIFESLGLKYLYIDEIIIMRLSRNFFLISSIIFQFNL